MSGGSSRRYPPELRERAVRMVAEISDQHESEWAAMGEVARLLGVDDGRNVGRWRRLKSRPRGRGYCAVLSARAEGSVSIPVSLSR